MKNLLVLSVIALLVASCSSYTISKESFVSQLKENQNIQRKQTVASLGTGFDANGLEKIKCVDKAGQEVWLYGGKNINFKVTTLDGKKQSMYFDTVYWRNDTIFGLKSRIVGGKRVIPVNQIATVGINAEEAETKPVN